MPAMVTAPALVRPAPRGHSGARGRLAGRCRAGARLVGEGLPGGALEVGEEAVEVGAAMVDGLAEEHFAVERKAKNVFVTDKSAASGNGSTLLNGAELFPGVPYLATEGAAVEARDAEGAVVLSASLSIPDAEGGADAGSSAATEMLLNAFKGSFAAGASDAVKSKMEEME